jgi:tRNA uracil 4-sulfurtransferase
MAGNRSVVLRYHEIALKGGNRAMFVRLLSDNVLRMLEGTGALDVRRAPGRLVVLLDAGADWAEIRSRLQRVFGVANFLLCQSAPKSVDTVTQMVVKAVGRRPIESFAVRTRRTDKTFPIPSPEVSRIVGSAVQDETGARVDLDHPAFEIHVEVLPREILFSLEKTGGPGGLPAGSSGAVVSLLSGGIDSPVATFRMMQRGCAVDLVHFHAVPYQSRAARDKALELAQVLNRWQPDLRAHFVPFGDVQREIVARVGRRPRVVLYRRMMMRIAARLAERVGAEALVTGESLGQVASQTLPNLVAIEQACPIPILRPLVGMDKLEITGQAVRLGTFPISIQPDEDCCQLFVPRHPATRMSIDEALDAEQGLDVAALAASALDAAETIELRFPAARPASDLRADAP